MSRLSTFLISIGLFIALTSSADAQHPLGPATGQRNILLILWDPHRPNHQAPSKAEIEAMMFGPSPSVMDFYFENSRGKLSVQRAGVLGWYDAKYPWQLYWRQTPYSPQDAVGTPHEYTDPQGRPRYLDDDGFYGGHSHKWAEAILRADQDFDFSQYDFNSNGHLSIDELAIVMIIPQAGGFGTRNTVVARQVPSVPLIVDGVRISDLAEIYMSSGSDMGLAAHELGHLVAGAPDLYFQCSSGFNHPYAASAFSIMDNHSNMPHFDPVEKYMYGWIVPSKVESSGPVVLYSVEDTGQVFKLERPGTDGKEYFLLENRARLSYDTGLPDEGLAIWHVIEDPEASKTIFDDAGVDQQKLPCVWGHWPRRGIRLIRPIRGSADDSRSLWDGSDPETGYDILSAHDGNPNHVILRWVDGLPSGYEIRNLSAAGQAMTFDLRVNNLVTLKSSHSQKVVRAGVGPESHLAAVSDHILGWEQFRVVPLSDQHIALVSDLSGKVVRAGVGPDSHLAAVSDHILAWETFEVRHLGGGKIALKSVHSGKWVRAGVGPDSHLAAVSDHIRAWETFDWISTTSPP